MKEFIAAIFILGVFTYGCIKVGYKRGYTAGELDMLDSLTTQLEKKAVNDSSVTRLKIIHKDTFTYYLQAK